MSPCQVLGQGAITCLGRGSQRLYQGWLAGVCGIQPLQRFDGRRYQSRMGAEVNPSLLPPAASWTERLAVAALDEALAENRPRGRTMLVLATTKAEIETVEAAVAGQAPERPVSPEALAGRLGKRVGLAPAACRVLSLACASGAVAIAYACQMLERGEADTVLVVGVDQLSDFVLTGFSSLKSLDPEPCKPFDRRRCGLSLGEAAGAMMLGRWDPDRPYRGLILGWGAGNDSHHLTAPARDGAGLANAMAASLRKAGLAPEAIHYINAHGTGTVYNDAMEAKAIAAVFGCPRTPPISSLKSVIGHTLGAAGVVETIATLEALAAGAAPPTRGLSAPGVEEPIDLIMGHPRELPKPGKALSLFAGFGGFNAVLALEGRA